MSTEGDTPISVRSAAAPVAAIPAVPDVPADEAPQYTVSVADGVDPSMVDTIDQALRNAYDPELGIDIVALGLVYNVVVEPDRVQVDMTLTTPGCPVAGSLPDEAADSIRLALPDTEVVMNIVWEPAWTPERLSREALDTLGYRR
jgi:metal-sulfur cluster biosynthetic enzyme